MSEAKLERIEAEFAKALEAVSATDLAALIPHIERYGLGGDLNTIFTTARPGAKVQRRFMPTHAQGTILKAALRTTKAQGVVQDVVIGMYAEELGDDVENPTLAQLQSATEVVQKLTSPALVKVALLGVVYREEVAEPHAIVVLRDQFDCDLTK